MDPVTPTPAPRLTVVVPAHTSEPYLHDCIESVLRQDVELEIVLVVEPSPDRTAAIARELAAADPRVVLLENTTAKGPGACRNAGLRAARGAYVTFVDSDDLVPDGAFVALVDALEESGSDLATGRADEFGGPAGRRPYWTHRAAVFENGVRGTTLARHPELAWDHTAWSTVHRREFLERSTITWPEGVLCEDVVPATRAYAAARSIDVLPRCTYLYRRRPGSITSRLTGPEPLVDWSTQTLEAISVLDGSGQAGALQQMIEKVLRHEAPRRIAAVAREDAATAAPAVRRCVEEVVRRAEPGTLDTLPVELLEQLGARPVAAPSAHGPVPAEMPLVSVIVPTRDVAPWIDECLQSILAQDHPALEVIVVDDASEDGTWEVIQEYAARDPRLLALRSPGRGGGTARDVGVARARGEFLAFADGDDVMPLHALSRLVEAARVEDAEIVVGGFMRFWSTGAWTATGYGLERRVASTRLLDHPALIRNRTCWNKLVRRELWDRLGLGFPDVPRANDIQPVTRLLAGAERITVIPEIVYEYRVRPGGGSMTDSLGTVASTVALLEQEAVCASVLRPHQDDRLGREHWVSVLDGDLWTAMGRLSAARPPTEALDTVTGLLSALLRDAPAPALQSIGPRRRLGLEAAARGDLEALSVMIDLDRRTSGTAPSTEGDLSPRSSAAAGVRAQVRSTVDVLVHSAASGDSAAAILTLVRESVLAPIIRAPGAWGTTADPYEPARADLETLRRTLRELARHVPVEEAPPPATDEPRLLAALLSENCTPGALERALRGEIPTAAADLTGIDGRVVTLEGDGPAPRRVLARALAADAGLPTPLPATIVPGGSGWTATVPLDVLPVGEEHLLLALGEDGLGEALAPLGLTAKVSAGRLDRIRFAGAPGAQTLKVLDGGAARAGRAVAWRLRRARRTLRRGRSQQKER